MAAKRNGKSPNGRNGNGNGHAPPNGSGKTARKTARGQKANGKALMPRPPLIAHPKANGGALYAGGVPGNAGGYGRPRSVIRDRAADLYDRKGMALLEKVMDGEKITQDITDMFGNLHEVERRPTVKERLEATKVLGTVGLGEMKELTVDDVRSRLQRTLTILRKRLTAEELVTAVQEGRAPLVLETVLQDLRPIWAA